MAKVSIEQKAERLARQFLECGVNVAVGIPGTGPILNFISAFVESGGQFLLCKHEGSAPIIAGNIGRRYGKPMVAICANGNARINLLSGILHCWFERLPVICLWDDFSVDHPTWQKLQKLPNHDIDDFFNWVGDINSLDADSLTRLAIESTLKPDYGPVGLPLCLNPRPWKSKVVNSCESPRLQANYEQTFSRPMIIVGSYIVRSEHQDAVSQLLQELKWPTLTTIGAKGIISEEHYYNLRVYTGVGGTNTPENILLSQCDSIIGIGLRHSDVIKVEELPKPALLLDFDKTPDNHGFGGRTQSIENLEGLRKVTCDFADSTWEKPEIQNIRDQGLESILVERNTVGQLISQASERLFNEVTVVVDDGVFQKQSEYLWAVNDSTQFVATGVGRNMGSALPTAIGLSIKFPDEKFVVLAGDGGLPLYLGELGMLKQHSHGDLIVIHIADYCLATMREKNLDNTSLLCQTSNRYGGVFSAFGFTSNTAADVNDALKIIDGWRDQCGDCFLEFEVPHDEYAKTIMLIRDRLIK